MERDRLLGKKERNRGRVFPTVCVSPSGNSAGRLILRMKTSFALLQLRLSIFYFLISRRLFHSS